MNFFERGDFADAGGIDLLDFIGGDDGGADFVGAIPFVGVFFGVDANPVTDGELDPPPVGHGHGFGFGFFGEVD
ncbi:hypothetical protein JZU69_05250, partial [bacterium]|nr:hypothetical protein [bacterium]